MNNSQPHVVVVGAGFGGLSCVRALQGVPVRLTVIDRSNHHLFQPLLYQVATATLSPADIAVPIRHILRSEKNTDVMMAEVTAIEPSKKYLQAGGKEISYDYLVIATGAHHGYFGHEDWEKHAPGLKSIADATAIRQKILYAFELAEMEADPAKREELLTFVLVGGGPTGVEMAGAIAELSHRALAADFRRIDPRSAKIILVEAGPRILPPFPESLSLKAKETLERLGVDVWVNTKVEGVSATGVYIAGKLLPSRTVIWAAGVVASPAGKWLGVQTDRAGRVSVGPDLTVAKYPEIFVIGDTANSFDESGKPLPGIAPVAMQQGRYVASAIAARVSEEGASLKPFRYWDKGNLATVGRSSAVCDLGKLKLSGWFAWVAWLAVHIYYLIGFRNRLMVLIEWAWAYLTFQRGARLITGEVSATSHDTKKNSC
jgi:NADH:ubiquinone reductase (H+-translocating)